MVIFETSRLIVRQYELKDNDNFFILNNHEDVVRYIRKAKTRVESEQFFIEVMNAYETQPQFGRWAAEDKNTNEFIGSVAIIPVQGKPLMQLGYALLPNEWGKGYATEMANEGLKYIFTKTDLDIIYAFTEAPNIASQKVLLKSGFKQDEKFNEGEKEIIGFRFTKDEYFALQT